MKNIIFGALIVLLTIIFTGCDYFYALFGLDAISDDAIGLRDAPLNDENVNLKDFSYISTPAGESKPIERAFENAPPMIPHDVEDMMEISADYNACLGCHSPDMAPLVNATSVPTSHTYDLRHNKRTEDGGIDESRYNCTTCHTPQANVAPIVENKFKADFRHESDKNKSNLLEVLDEGVE